MCDAPGSFSLSTVVWGFQVVTGVVRSWILIAESRSAVWMSPIVSLLTCGMIAGPFPGPFTVRNKDVIITDCGFCTQSHSSRRKTQKQDGRVLE